MNTWFTKLKKQMDFLEVEGIRLEFPPRFFACIDQCHNKLIDIKQSDDPLEIAFRLAVLDQQLKDLYAYRARMIAADITERNQQCQKNN